MIIIFICHTSKRYTVDRCQELQLEAKEAERRRGANVSEPGWSAWRKRLVQEMALEVGKMMKKCAWSGENDEEMVRKWWKNDGQIMEHGAWSGENDGKWWRNDGKMMVSSCFISDVGCEQFPFEEKSRCQCGEQWGRIGPKRACRGCSYQPCFFRCYMSYLPWWVGCTAFILYPFKVGPPFETAFSWCK